MAATDKLSPFHAANQLASFMFVIRTVINGYLMISIAQYAESQNDSSRRFLAMQ